jgi:hypothetical protein
MNVMNEMQIAFPGQTLVAKEDDNGRYISVPKTEANEQLLKRRGYFWERGENELRVYSPDPTFLND